MQEVELDGKRGAGCGWYVRCVLWMAGKVLDVAGIRVWRYGVRMYSIVRCTVGCGWYERC